MAGSKSAKLPKRIAGVKLSPKLRKSGGKVRAMFASPMAQGILEKLITAALGAAVAKFADSAAGREAGGVVKDKAKDAAEGLGELTGTSGKRVKRKARASAKPRGKRKAV